jgi:hypothetical protein
MRIQYRTSSFLRGGSQAPRLKMRVCNENVLTPGQKAELPLARSEMRLLCKKICVTESYAPLLYLKEISTINCVAHRCIEICVRTPLQESLLESQ